MTRLWVGVIAFVGGIATGLVIADLYAKYKVQGTIDKGLNAVGLGGGAVQSFIDTSVVPTLVG